ncbi:hypothetical protein BDQ17DRAFT_787714 [Cyathus striatus]|nr:hypothetical protein BDQ17DRAFT_787714 [Cyathus striatus]
MRSFSTSFLLAAALSFHLLQAAAAPVAPERRDITFEARALSDILQNIECSSSAAGIVSGLNSALSVVNKINTTDATITNDLASVKGFLNKAATLGNAVVGACNKASSTAATQAQASAAAAARTYSIVSVDYSD